MHQKHMLNYFKSLLDEAQSIKPPPPPPLAIACYFSLENKVFFSQRAVLFRQWQESYAKHWLAGTAIKAFSSLLNRYIQLSGTQWCVGERGGPAKYMLPSTP
ncbi:hypothetical protein CEXT_634931 [Caerostris extrusa]|uniref:Uncharacterized protein n=1 Tax=Caerostris extrusa TaxID=172846 RepID=A0AAV4WFU5_CAEEX|nr:hypothetical protein CEXT_634931 [Caerostris extrusa]